MALDVEDELAGVERGTRDLKIERGVGVELEIAAATTCCPVGRIHAEQSGRRATGRYQERTAALSKPPRVARRRFECEMPRVAMHRFQRNGRKFSVGRRVELDRQSRAVRIVTIVHRELASTGWASSSKPSRIRFGSH